jgi:hypothetical protein
MPFNTDTFGRAAFKRLYGFAHTNNSFDVGNENISSNVVIAAQDILGPRTTIPSTASSAVTNGIAVAITCKLEQIAGNPSAYRAKINGAVSSTALNGKLNRLTGTNYVNDDVVGFFIPFNYGEDYRVTIKDDGAALSPFDNRDWFFDYRTGILFSEDSLDLGSAGTIDGYVFVGEFLSDAIARLQWDTNGSHIYNTNSGNVGIGTSTPQFKLDLVGASPNTVVDNFVTSFGSQIPINSWAGIHFGFSEASNALYRKSGLIFERTDAAGRGKIHLLNNNSATSASATLADSRLTILPDGKTGIGTTNPQRVLHIKQDAAITAGTLVAFENAGTTLNNDIVLSFRSSTTSASFVEMAAISSVFTNHTPSGYASTMSFFTSNAGTSSERVKISGTGEIVTIKTVDSSPAFLRMFRGDINQSSFLFTYGNGGHGVMQTFNTSGAVKAQIHAGGISYLTGGQFGVGTDTPLAATKVDFRVDNTNTGTSSPNNPILVLSNLAAPTTGSGTTLGFSFNTNASTAIGAAITGINANSNGGAHLGFSTRATGGTFAERMRIDAGGKVGIGTLPGTNQVEIRSSASSSTLALNPNTSLGEFGTSSNHDLMLMTNSVERVRISTTGNVTLGTSTSPTIGLFVTQPYPGSVTSDPKVLIQAKAPNGAGNNSGIDLQSRDDSNVLMRASIVLRDDLSTGGNKSLKIGNAGGIDLCGTSGDPAGLNVGVVKVRSNKVLIGTGHGSPPASETPRSAVLDVIGNTNTNDTVASYISQIVNFNTNTGGHAVLRLTIGEDNPDNENDIFLAGFADVFDADDYGTRVFHIDGDGNLSTSFTSQHWVVLEVSELSSATVEFSPGLIVSSTGVLWNKTRIETGNPIVRLSAIRNDKGAYGIIAGNFANVSKDLAIWNNFPHDFNIGSMPENGQGTATYSEESKFFKARVNGGGDGQVWVTNINGEVQNGDYITTSEIGGYGMRQDDDLLHSYTVAKCVEQIDWNNVAATITHDGIAYKKYLTGCTYHCA